MSQNQLPHVRVMSLHNDGIVQEIIVLQEDQRNGDMSFIEVSALDAIDRKRIIRILTRRDAARYPLPELMAQETLNNGMNALTYFHQMVRVRTANGYILPIGSGKSGAPPAPMAVAPPKADKAAK